MIRAALIAAIVTFPSGFLVGKSFGQAERVKEVVRAVDVDRAQAERDQGEIDDLKARIKELSNAVEARECLSAGDSDRLRSLWTTP